MIDRIHSTPAVSADTGPKRPKNPQEAAKQFEETLIREFVRTMTKDMFKGIGGDDTPGWVKAQGDSQADTLAGVLTKHLVDEGSLGISEMLLRQWGVEPSEDLSRSIGPIELNRETEASPLEAPGALPLSRTPGAGS